MCPEDGINSGCAVRFREISSAILNPAVMISQNATEIMNDWVTFNWIKCKYTFC